MGGFVCIVPALLAVLRTLALVQGGNARLLCTLAGLARDLQVLNGP